MRPNEQVESRDKWHPQGLVLGLALSKIFISTMDSRVECTLGKFVNNAADAEELGNIQRDLDRVGRWAHVNLMKFNKAKGEALNVVQGNPKHKYRMGREWIESSPEEEGLVDMTGQCAFTAHKANHILG
ncbi:hypothetical protein DUI87_20425 [Hirundo rustica rustica]|uniref:Rna-directed dna polymerase from mobile element jockey-like n=1 Tax=Hirundo rustica rustica TaxID=333673 RepID=A0A3M0JSN4_HIRRU|nr:hypothetical protein DUI87_20425 [Hirundo rustica rustica]